MSILTWNRQEWGRATADSVSHSSIQKNNTIRLLCRFLWVVVVAAAAELSLNVLRINRLSRGFPDAAKQESLVLIEVST
jgi:hypothetical protein